jgi:DNA end-binding protein Ku
LSEIDPIYFQKSYYLAPDEGGQKAFRLLHDAMGEMGRVAMGKVVIKEKEHLVAVRPYDGALVMNTLFYADEIRAVNDIPEFPIQTKVLPNEMKMALELIQGLSASFAPQEYKDDYRAALKKLIDAKIEGEELVAPVKEERKVVDLMDALKRSLEMTQRPARGRRSRAASHSRAAAMRERHR